MTMDHWKTGSWQRFRVQGLDGVMRALPGRVLSCDVVSSADVSHAKSKGTNGVNLKSEGVNGKTIELVIEVWTSAQLAEIEAAFEPLRTDNPDSFKAPIKVDHPNCYFHRVEYIASAKVSSGMPANGRWPISVSMLQWFDPEEKTKAKGTGSPNPPGGDTTGDTTVPQPDPANLGADFP